jgi:group II intron reverse transcriptase/maturase
MLNTKYNEIWKNINWKQARMIVFRLQCRIWKAMRVGDKRKVLNLQKLLLKSRSARLLAIRQVTQLNAGKKTAGIDGKAKLTFKERLELEETLRRHYQNWKHQGVKEVPIPKKDGTTRTLKVPTIADRAWQCLIKYAIEPAHEATFHARSYGFRPGRSAHDAQKTLFNNLSSKAKGIDKRILELDIEKCFDKINHNSLMEKVIAPQAIKTGIFRCLKAGTNPEFPEQGTPQGGVVSPLLANIALNGIEKIHQSVRYADDMVFILKPEDNAIEIRHKIDEFLAERGLNVKESKTKLTRSTDGFDFLGWHCTVQLNGKFRSYPSKDNYEAVKKKIKEVVNNSQIGAKGKATKLASIVRGWRNYHRHCKMDKHSLYHTQKRAFIVFNKESKLDRYSAKELLDKAFPTVTYSENRFVPVKGDASPFDGNIIYWSKRQNQSYDRIKVRILNKQHHSCGQCGLKFSDEERIHLHHIDGNHDNWKPKNLIVVHESCHDYIHMSKQVSRELDA